MRTLIHFIAFCLLTIVTQIGGVIYVASPLLVKNNAERRRIKCIGVFIVLYLFSTYLIVPTIAPVFGREKIKESAFVQAHSVFYKLANRNYVRPELNQALANVAKRLNRKHNGIILIYLDANFPFIDKFPLLPHLSHNDGEKVDVTLIYKELDGTVTNKKPSRSGYGVYENPTANEYDQTQVCKERGNWQYDFPKYLTFGAINKEH